MGVPRIFGWIERKIGSKKIVVSDPDDRIDNYYIDDNCMIHPHCFIVLNFFPDWEDQRKLEDVMMKRVISYQNYTVSLVNPKKQLLIAVDGVAPQAKSAQQRYRRFRSIEDIAKRNSILRKDNITPPRPWKNVCITPGTEFMERFHEIVIDSCKELKKRRKSLSIVYSSYHTEGEGEHKIVDNIRNRIKINPESINETDCIYGLDADLIFLALCLRKPNVYLLREATMFGRPKTMIDYQKDDPVKDISQELLFVSIDAIRQGVFDIISTKIGKKELTINSYDVCDDFTFFCFLVGNDFVPHLPSLDISTGGLDLLVEVYTETLKKLNTRLTDRQDMTIDSIFLEEMLYKVQARENHYFQIILPRYIEKQKARRCDYTQQHKIDLWEWENMRDKEYDDPVKLGNGDPKEYKYRYYKHYFNIIGDGQDMIDSVCREYLKGVKWIMEYYFKGCISFNWKYPYLVAPFASDLYAYMKYNHVDFNSFTFNEAETMTPCEQLLSVIPPQSRDLLPLSYQELTVSATSPIIDLFPMTVELDTINKLIEFKCYPKIPLADVDRIKNATRGKKLTPRETVRNSLYGPITF